MNLTSLETLLRQTLRGANPTLVPAYATVTPAERRALHTHLLPASPFHTTFAPSTTYRAQIAPLFGPWL